MKRLISLLFMVAVAIVSFAATSLDNSAQEKVYAGDYESPPIQTVVFNVNENLPVQMIVAFEAVQEAKLIVLIGDSSEPAAIFNATRSEIKVKMNSAIYATAPPKYESEVF